jgi:hypothetical protein
MREWLKTGDVYQGQVDNIGSDIILESEKLPIKHDLIQKIINIKLAENQLDECGLTLGDLSIVKSSFKEILLSSLHQRPKYPSSEDTKKLENKEDLKKTVDKKLPAKKMRISRERNKS